MSKRCGTEFWFRLVEDWKQEDASGVTECLRTLAGEPFPPFERSTGGLEPLPNLSSVFQILCSIVIGNNPVIGLSDFAQECALLVLHRLLYNPEFCCCIPHSVLSSLCYMANTKSNTEELTEVMEVVYFVCVNRLSSSHRREWCSAAIQGEDDDEIKCNVKQVDSPSRSLFIQKVHARLTWALADGLTSTDEVDDGLVEDDRFAKYSLACFALLLQVYPDECLKFQTESEARNSLCRVLIETLNSNQPFLSSMAFFTLGLLVQVESELGQALFSSSNLAHSFNLLVEIVNDSSTSYSDSVCCSFLARHLVSTMNPELVNRFPIDQTLETFGSVFLSSWNKTPLLLLQSNPTNSINGKESLMSELSNEIPMIQRNIREYHIRHMKLMWTCMDASDLFRNRVVHVLAIEMRKLTNGRGKLLPPWWIYQGQEDMWLEDVVNDILDKAYTIALEFGCNIMSTMLLNTGSQSVSENKQCVRTIFKYLIHISSQSNPAPGEAGNLNLNQSDDFVSDSRLVPAISSYVMKRAPEESLKRVFESVICSTPSSSAVAVSKLWDQIIAALISLELDTIRTNDFMNGLEIPCAWGMVQGVVNLEMIEKAILGCVNYMSSDTTLADDPKYISTVCTLCYLVSMLCSLAQSQTELGINAHACLSSVLGKESVTRCIGATCGYSGTSFAPVKIGLELVVSLCGSAAWDRYRSSVVSSGESDTIIQLLVRGVHEYNSRTSVLLKQTKERMTTKVIPYEQQDRLNQLVQRESVLRNKQTFLEARNQKLESQLGAYQAKEKKWETDSNLVEEKLSKLIQRETALQQAIENNALELQIRTDNFSSELEAIRSAKRTSDAKLKAAQKELERYKLECASLKDKHLEMAEEIQRVKNQSSELEKQHANQVEEHEGVCFKLVQLSKLYQKNQEELEDIKKRAELDAQVLLLERDRTSQLLSRVEIAERNEATVQEENKRLLQELNDLKVLHQSKEQILKTESEKYKEALNKAEHELNKKQSLLDQHASFTRLVRQMSTDLAKE